MIEDDLELLEEMMQDLDEAPARYKPTTYWERYQEKILPELRKKGLRDFRRRRDSVLRSFGATDLNPGIKVDMNFRFKGSSRVAQWLRWLLQKNPIFKISNDYFIAASPEETTEYFYRKMKQKFSKQHYDITRCPTTTVGNPENIIEIDGGYYSFNHLIYCSMFIDAAKKINLTEGVTVCELGAGLGRNFEIMANLFPKGTFFLFEIPPQLYVTNQYLKSVFGDRVITYRDAKHLSRSNREKYRGKIIILPSFKFEYWSETGIDLFWNSASFQEMEPEIVKNYLNLTVNMNPTWIYINARPEGKGKSHEIGGTNKAVTEETYRKSLKDSYDLKEKFPSDYFLRAPTWYSFIFEKNG